MRPVYLTLAALGDSKWVTINYLQNAFGIGLGVTLSSDANLTCKVQHTFDDPVDDSKRLVSIARSGTAATVTDNLHGLSTGDSVIIQNSGDPNLDTNSDIGADITIVDANSYTYVVANTGAAASGSNVWLKSFRIFDHSTLTGITGANNRSDGNYQFPPLMVRFKTTAYVAGRATLAIIQGMGH